MVRGKSCGGGGECKSHPPLSRLIHPRPKRQRYKFYILPAVADFCHRYSHHKAVCVCVIRFFLILNGEAACQYDSSKVLVKCFFLLPKTMPKIILMTYFSRGKQDFNKIKN